MIRVGLKFWKSRFRNVCEVYLFQLTNKNSLSSRQPKLYAAVFRLWLHVRLSDAEFPMLRVRQSLTKLKPLYSPKNNHKIYQNLTLNPAQATKPLKLNFKELGAKQPAIFVKKYIIGEIRTCD